MLGNHAAEQGAVAQRADGDGLEIGRGVDPRQDGVAPPIDRVVNRATSQTKECRSDCWKRQPTAISSLRLIPLAFAELRARRKS